MKEMKEVFDNVPHDHILNADETGWKLLPKGILTWGETGVDNLSKQAKINDKTQITVLAVEVDACLRSLSLNCLGTSLGIA